jgi:hypothetical protein
MAVFFCFFFFNVILFFIILFMAALGFWTQGLTLTRQAFLTLEPCHQPHGCVVDAAWAPSPK